MKTTTIGVFPNHDKNEKVISDLMHAGIAETEISCIYLDRKGDMHDTQSGEKLEDGAVKGVTAGAVVGAVAGLVVANGILPGLGTIFVAGPLLAGVFGLGAAAATTVAGAATGAVAGGIIGAMVNLGISEDDARLYEENLKKGNVVFITRSDLNTAKDVLIRNGANEIREYTM